MIEANIGSLVKLGQRAGVDYSTMFDWWRGATRPSTRLLIKLADVLHVSAASLWAAYEGTEYEPNSVIDALNAQRAAFEAQTAKMQELLEFVRSSWELAARGIAEGAAEAARDLQAATDGGESPPGPKPRRPRRSPRGRQGQ